jgi:hypothetical protein
VEGYAPPGWLTLRYSSPDLDSVVGLVRSPFLGPFKKTLLAGAPSADAPVSAFLEDQIAQQPSGVNWTDVHAFYRDSEAAARTITVYGGGAARLYRFSTPDAMLFFPQYTPYPLRVASHNGGWFLEIVSIFGDGAYSTLFRIDPQGKITFQPLSRSSGEDDQDVEASWGVLDGKLWVARAAGTKVTLTGVSSLHLAVMGTSSDYVTPIDRSAAVFPSPAANRVEWITGIPFLTEAEAKRNAGGRTIRRYP